MAFCPACNAEWQTSTEDCPICGRELTPPEEQREWVVLGTIDDKLSADFARETLRTYEIPAVVVSKSGYFGNIGLTLTSFYSGKRESFEVSVPGNFREEAAEILDMILGGRWHRKDSE